MSNASLLYLDFKDRSVPVSISELDTDVSPLSGRELQVIYGTVSTSEPEMHDWFLQALREEGAAGVRARPHAEFGELTWVVSSRSHTVSGGSYSYSVELREHEDLILEALVLDGIETAPHQYHEEASKEGIRIDAKVKVSKGVADRLEEMIARGGYFPVIRRGIQDAPREMRFGAVYWSEHEDGIKYSLVLVERTPSDEQPQMPWNLPEQAARFNLAHHMGVVTELLNLLENKGLLTSEARAQINERALQGVPKRERSFFKVRDVDDLPL